MRLYIKKNETFTVNVTKDSFGNHQISGFTIFDYHGTPYVESTEDFELLMYNELLSQVFLKATIVTFPRYSTNVYENRRCLGIYHYGNAIAELTPAQNVPYCLKIETSCWKCISNMRILQEKLWAGTITPKISYEGKQKKQHPLDVLRQILDSRNLGPLQRFILALRLERQ